MNKYELMTIVSNKLSEQEARDVLNSIKDLVSAGGGRVLNSDFWGKRKFAYEIKGATEGWYEVATFEVSQNFIPKFKQKLNIMENVVRYLLINLAKEARNGGKNGKKSQ